MVRVEPPRLARWSWTIDFGGFVVEGDFVGGVDRGVGSWALRDSWVGEWKIVEVDDRAAFDRLPVGIDSVWFARDSLLP